MKRRSLTALFGALCLFAFAAPDLSLADEGKWKEKKARMFETMDEDGSGTINRDEFLAAHQKKAERRFEKIDADGDGEITQEEMAEARKKFRKHWKKKKGHYGEKSESEAKE